MFKLLVVFLSVAFLSACTTLPKPSVVISSADSKQAVVAVGDVALAEGDQVGVFIESCTRRPRRTPPRDVMNIDCTKNRVGAARVTSLTANRKEAILNAAGRTSLFKGQLVEKE